MFGKKRGKGVEGGPKIGGSQEVVPEEKTPQDNLGEESKHEKFASSISQTKMNKQVEEGEQKEAEEEKLLRENEIIEENLTGDNIEKRHAG